MFALLTAILDSTTVSLLLSFMGWVGVGALLLLFKPLLTGIARALLLLIKPHLTKEQRIARRKMRDSILMQKMINASTGPSDMAELRAMASRG